MISDITSKRKNLSYRILSCFIAVSFVFNVVLPPGYAQLIPQTLLNLPAPGTMVSLSAGFTPALVRGMTIHPDNPLQFDFFVSKGDAPLAGEALKAESRKLIKYFLASLTVPEEELWVNLSPYEKDRIIPQGFGETEMGRDLLAQDYILKQLTASLMYPEEELGKKFWDKVYRQARAKYGTAEIPVDTFNKVWIVPEKAVVYEHGNSVFVVESRLKVMLEQDYVAMNQGTGDRVQGTEKLNPNPQTLNPEIIREIIIPALEKEVNEGKSFASLRQIYNSSILAVWYKQKFTVGTGRDLSLLGQVYVNQNKTKGIDVEDKTVKEKIYSRYLEAFKKGVYNYIKEDYDPATHSTIPRKYFSGGTNLTSSPVLVTISKKTWGEYPLEMQKRILAAMGERVLDIRWVGVENADDETIAQAESQKPEAPRKPLKSSSSPVDYEYWVKKLGLGETDLIHMKNLMEKFNAPKISLVIGKNSLPSALLTDQQRKNLLGAIDYGFLAQDETNAAAAKNVVVTFNPMDGGLGTSVKREAYLETEMARLKDDPKTGRARLGAKATDLFFDVKFPGRANPDKVSIAEIKLLRVINDASQFGSVVFQPLVNMDSAPSYRKLLDSQYLLDKVDARIPESAKRTYRQVMEEKGVHLVAGSDAMLYQKDLPVIDPEAKVLTDKYTAPGGHGQWGVRLLLDALNFRLPNDGRTHIRAFYNGDGIANFPDAAVIGWMARENVPVVMISTTKTSADKKGGQLGIQILDDGSVRPQILELAQAKEAGQGKLFGAIGLPGFDKVPGDHAKEYRNEASRQYFNTNIAILNYNALTPVLIGLAGLEGVEFNGEILSGREVIERIIAPDLIANKKEKPDGKEYTQLEGAIGSSLLNLNAFFAATKDERVKALLAGKKLFRIVNVDVHDRTKFFTPVKSAFDFWFQAYSDYYVLDAEGWSLRDNGSGLVPPAVNFTGARRNGQGDIVYDRDGKPKPEDFYDDVQNVINAFGHASVKELTELNIEGKILLKDAVLKGNVSIVSHYPFLFDLNKPEAMRVLGQEGGQSLVLYNIKITVAEDGSVASEWLAASSPVSGDNEDIYSSLEEEVERPDVSSSPAAMNDSIEKSSSLLNISKEELVKDINSRVKQVKLLNDLAEMVGISPEQVLKNMVEAGFAVSGAGQGYSLTEEFYSSTNMKNFRDQQVKSSSNPQKADASPSSLARLERIILSAIDVDKFFQGLALLRKETPAQVIALMEENNLFPTLVSLWEERRASELLNPDLGIMTVQDIVDPAAADFYKGNGVEANLSLPSNYAVSLPHLSAVKHDQSVVVTDMKRGGFSYRGEAETGSIQDYFERFFKAEWYNKIQDFIKQQFSGGRTLEAIVTNGIGANDQFMWSLVEMYNRNKPADAPAWYHVVTARDLVKLQNLDPQTTLEIDISRSGSTWEGVEAANLTLTNGFKKRIVLANGGDLKAIADQINKESEGTALVIGMEPHIGGRNMHRKTPIYYTAQTVAGMFLPAMDSTVFAALHHQFDQANDFGKGESLAVNSGKFLHALMRLKGIEHIAFISNSRQTALIGSELSQYVMEGSNKEHVISWGDHDLTKEPDYVLENSINSPSGKITVGIVILDKASENYAQEKQKVEALEQKIPLIKFTIDSRQDAGFNGISPRQQAAFDILWTDFITVLTTLLRVDANSNPNVKVVRTLTTGYVSGWEKTAQRYKTDGIGTGTTKVLLSLGIPGSEQNSKIGTPDKQRPINTVEEAKARAREVVNEMLNAAMIKGRNRLNLFGGAENTVDFIQGLRNETYKTDLVKTDGWIAETGIYPIRAHKGHEATLASSGDPNNPLLGDKSVDIFLNQRYLGDDPFYNRTFQNKIGTKKYDNVIGANIHQTNDSMTFPNIQRTAQVSPTILLEFQYATPEVQTLIKAFQEAFVSELENAVPASSPVELQDYLKERQASKELKQEEVEAVVKGVNDWLSRPYPKKLVDKLQRLIEGRDWATITESFYKEVEFGTAGKRGRQVDEDGDVLPGPNNINDYTVAEYTLGLARYFLKTGQKDRGVVLGGDTRIKSVFSYRDEEAYVQLQTKILRKLGIKVYRFNAPRSIGHVAWTTVQNDAASMEYNSASHNMWQDNGVKASNEFGAQLFAAEREGILNEIKDVTPEDIAALELNAFDLEQDQKQNPNNHILLGSAQDHQNDPSIVDADSEYIELNQSYVQNPEIVRDYSGEVNSFYTPIQGSGFYTMPSILTTRNFKFKVVVSERQRYQDPYGRFNTTEKPDPNYVNSNTGVGTMDQGINEAQEIERRTGVRFDLIFGTDPDSDRSSYVVRDRGGKWMILNANDVWSLFAWYRLNQLRKQGGISEGMSAVATWATSDLIADIAQDSQFNLRVYRPAVGFNKIAEVALKEIVLPVLAQRHGVKLEQLRQIRVLTLDKLVEAFGVLSRKMIMKEINEILREYMLFGAEESNGYSPGGHTLEKDGSVAAVTFHEIAAFVKYINKNKEQAMRDDPYLRKYFETFKDKDLTIYELLNRVYLEYGYYATENIPLQFDGLTGNAQKAKVLENIANLAVNVNANPGATNFNGKGIEKAFTGKEQTSTENVQFNELGYKFILGGRDYVLTRPSGTEPYIRFYGQTRVPREQLNWNNIESQKMSADQETVKTVLAAQAMVNAASSPAENTDNRFEFDDEDESFANPESLLAEKQGDRLRGPASSPVGELPHEVEMLNFMDRSRHWVVNMTKISAPGAQKRIEVINEDGTTTPVFLRAFEYKIGRGTDEFGRLTSLSDDSFIYVDELSISEKYSQKGIGFTVYNWLAHQALENGRTLRMRTRDAVELQLSQEMLTDIKVGSIGNAFVPLMDPAKHIMEDPNVQRFLKEGKDVEVHGRANPPLPVVPPGPEMIRKISSLDVAGKKVFLRVDHNGTFQDGKVTSKQRINANTPTVAQLFENGARLVIMATHAEKPKGQVVEKMSPRPVAEYLKGVFRGVRFMARGQGETPEGYLARVKDFIDTEKPQGILYLDNLRFDPREQSDKPEERLSMARQLKALADVYINDAFSVDHRADTSVYDLAYQFTPEQRAGGSSFLKELENLYRFEGELRTLRIPHESLAVIAGSKLGGKEGKLHLLKGFSNRVNKLRVEGLLAVTFLKMEAQKLGRYDIALSMQEASARLESLKAGSADESEIKTAKKKLDDLQGEVKELREAEELMEFFNTHKALGYVAPSIVSDFMAVPRVDLTQPPVKITREEFLSGARKLEEWTIIDTGPEELATLKREARDSALVFWNGSLGWTDMPAKAGFNPQYGQKATWDFAQYLSLFKGKVKVAIGGGNTIADAQSAGLTLEDAFDVVLLGGGASQEFLIQVPLPGIQPLLNVPSFTSPYAASSSSPVTIDEEIRALEGELEKIKSYIAKAKMTLRLNEDAEDNEIDEMGVEMAREDLEVYKTLEKEKLDEIEKLKKEKSGQFQASSGPGGIDLNPALLDLQIRRDANFVPLPLPQQPIGEMRIDGFTPVIINITPVSNLPMLLGLADTEPDTDDTNTNPALKAREPEEISALN